MFAGSIGGSMREVSDAVLNTNGDDSRRSESPDFRGWDFNLDMITKCPLCGLKVTLPMKMHLTQSHNISINLDRVLAPFRSQRLQDLEEETTSILKKFLPEPSVKLKMPVRSRGIKTQTDPFIMLGNFQRFELKHGPNYVTLKKKSILKKALCDAGFQIKDVCSISREVFEQGQAEQREPIIVKIRKNGSEPKMAPKEGNQSLSRPESPGDTLSEESRKTPPIPKLKITRINGDADVENGLDLHGNLGSSTFSACTDSAYRVTPVFDAPGQGPVVKQEHPCPEASQAGLESQSNQGQQPNQPINHQNFGKGIKVSLKLPKNDKLKLPSRSLLKKNSTRANILKNLKKLKSSTSSNSQANQIVPSLSKSRVDGQKSQEKVLDPVPKVLPSLDGSGCLGTEKPVLQGIVNAMADDFKKPVSVLKGPVKEESLVAPRQETFREWSRGKCKFFCGICNKKDFETSYDLYKHVEGTHKIDIGSYRKNHPNVYLEKKHISCKVCRKQLIHDISKLTQHISGLHKINLRSYYDKYVLPDNE